LQCIPCFNAVLSNCLDGITVNGGFISGHVYKWLITDKFSNKYSSPVIAGEDGSIFIDPADLPEGFLNPYAGDLLLSFTDAVDGKPVPVAVCQVYECVNIKIKKNTPDVIETEIGNCTSDGGAKIKRAFTAAATLDYDWTLAPFNTITAPLIQVYKSIGLFQYELMAPTIQQTFDINGVLQSVHIDLGGTFDGFVVFV
jgi:hypothetical protein